MMTDSLKSYIISVFKFKNPVWCEINEHFQLTFTFSPEDTDELKALQECGLLGDSFKKNFKSSRKTPVNLGQLEENKSYSVEIKSSHEVKLYPSFKVLVDNHPVKCPKNFFIFSVTSEPVVFRDGDKVIKSSPLKHYLEICKIWKLLSKKSDDSDYNSMLFLYRKKLLIPSRYNEEMLQIEFDGLTNFCDTMENDDTDKTEKSHILQNVLYNFLFHKKEEERFSYLLSNFSKFESRFDDDYQAYIVGFSFKELRVEYEEKYREYIHTINDSISAGITKTFAIPASIYLTSTRVQSIQTASEKNHSEILAANIGIGFISLTVTIFIILMVVNELHSLNALKFEYKSLMERLEEKSKPAYEKVGKLSLAIERRIKFAKRVFISIGFITVVHTIVSFIWIYIRSTTDSSPDLHSNLIVCITNILSVLIKLVGWSIA